MPSPPTLNQHRAVNKDRFIGLLLQQFILSFAQMARSSGLALFLSITSIALYQLSLKVSGL
jgi:hypothetical protein